MLSTQRYSVVLAGGAGSRLRTLTMDAAGVSVPKQFCTFNGGPSLLRKTIGRLAPIVPRSHICAVVSEHHEPWWRGELNALPSSNVIVQPIARGTGIGLLLALLIIEQRDPEAIVLATPADHHVAEPDVLMHAMDDALIAASGGDRVVVLGVEPRVLDPEFGYLSVGDCDRYGLYDVADFVERPTDLLRRAGREHLLWNSFIFAGTCEALLDLFDACFPEIVLRMRAALGRYDHKRFPGVEIRTLFHELPAIDFSRDVLMHAPTRLSALSVEDCGLCDLGTPARIADTLRRAGVPVVDQGQAGSRTPDLALAVTAGGHERRVS